MTRLTDDFMADLERKHAAIENEYRPTCETVNYGNGCPGATDASVGFWRAAVDCVPAMLAELRERRAADLTSFEHMVLTVLRDRIHEDPLGDREMVRILDKALGKVGGP
jgi:hypothetical protein